MAVVRNELFQRARCFQDKLQVDEAI